MRKILVILLCFGVVSCSRLTQLQLFSIALEKCLTEFGEQGGKTQEELKEAEEARRLAIVNSRMEFNHPNTRAFISQWKSAEKEVQRQRVRFNEVLESADYLFAYCEKKRDSIKDLSMRRRMTSQIEKRKAVLSQQCVSANKAISALEAIIDKGNDIITSLEITGVLNALDQEIQDLGILEKNAYELAPEINNLAEQGLKILNFELADEEPVS